MLSKVLRLRASSTAFSKGRLVFTDWNTGCFRNLLFKAYGIKDEFKEEITARGALNEERFAQRLRREGVDFLREQDSPVQSVTAATSWRGRTDFLRRGCVPAVASKESILLELKSTGSKSKLRDLKSGKYTTENLAQLVAYMLDFNIMRGSLIYTYYEGQEAKYEREFKVELDNVGTIIVDNVATEFTAQDQLEHRLRAAEVLENDIIADRPYNWDAAWGSPCHFCPFKSACDKYDKHEIETSEGLILEASNLVRSKC